MIVAMRRDADANDDEAMKQWKAICLSTTMTFKIYENGEAFHFAHLQLRNDPGIQFETVRATALNMVLDVNTFQNRHVGGKLTAKRLAECYKRLTTAERSEKITESFCDMALTVYNRLVLKSPQTFELLLSLDEDEGVNNPLDSVSKLQAVVIKTGSKEGLEWFMPIFVDFFKVGLITPDDCSLRSLEGVSKTAVKKGLIDVMMAKRDIRDYLFQWGHEQHIDSAILNNVKECAASINVFRRRCGYLGGARNKQHTPDQSWKSGWPNSAHLLLNLYESIVFGREYDESILENLKAKKVKPAEMLKEEPFEELLQEVATALEAERSSASAGPAEADAPQQPDPTEDGDGDQDDTDPIALAAKAHGIEAEAVLREVPLGDSETHRLNRYIRQAEQYVSANVCLVHELMSDEEIITLLKGSGAGSALGSSEKKTHVLVWYDQQEGGESSAQPHLRIPPLRSKGQHLQRFIRLAMERTDTPDEIRDQDVFIVNDAGRSGNKTAIVNSFQNKAGEVLIYCVVSRVPIWPWQRTRVRGHWSRSRMVSNPM